MIVQKINRLSFECEEHSLDSQHQLEKPQWCGSSLVLPILRHWREWLAWTSWLVRETNAMRSRYSESTCLSKQSR